MNASSSPWPLIHAERGALAADVEHLTPAQWDAASLCAGWTVRDVFGHMTATAKMTPPKFFLGLAKSGFRFNAMNEANIARETGCTPAEGVAEFERLLTATDHPPGPVEAMLGEAVIHSEDIRRPLGLARAYPPEAVVRVAAFFQGSNLLIGAKSRIAGLTLRATDSEWRTGSGPEVAGPTMALVLAMTGRPAGLAELSGDGLETLKARMPAGAAVSRSS